MRFHRKEEGIDKREMVNDMMEVSILCNMVILPTLISRSYFLSHCDIKMALAATQNTAVQVIFQGWLGEEVRKGKAVQNYPTLEDGCRTRVGSRPRKMRRTEVGLTEEGGWEGTCVRNG